MSTIKCIGILTSGGDAPGMNAAIRAVTRSAIYNGMRVKGIFRGYRGLITGEIEEFKTQNVSNIIQRGGTILKTARCMEFKTPEGRKQAYDKLVEEGIDALIAIGGDGTLTGARIFAQEFNYPIVGVPGTIDNDLYGAGKSTSIDVFGMHLIKEGRKLAVLAIDPSSERSKGSILGDKTRMEALSREKNAFIRPSPSAGSLGGVARKTRETIVLCEAAGFDTVFVETVGVGQSETAVHSMVDFFLLIQLAGTGDELQGIKRGIMEMADGIIINKADGDNIEKAKLAAAQFRNALHLFPPADSGWFPKVLTYSGYYNLGIKEIWDMVGEYMEFTKKNGYFNFKRNEQAKYWMYESINDTLRETFYHNPAVEGMLIQTEQQVLNNEISSFVAAKRMMDLFLENLSKK